MEVEGEGEGGGGAERFLAVSYFTGNAGRQADRLSLSMKP